MVKKRGKRKSSGKKSHKTVHHTQPQKIVIQQAPIQKESKMDTVLIENFVSLQRVLTNLSVKLDNVATQMTKLLDLFEISARALAEKDFEVDKNDKEILEKLENVLDQNKTLARGLTLMHERMPQPQDLYPPQPQIRPLPPMPPMPQGFQQQSMQQKQEMPRMKDQGPAKKFSKEIDEEPELEPLEPPQFESPI